MEENVPWKIIIADDEPEVHNLTRMVLDDFEFDGRQLVFLSAYSGKETEQLLRENPDTAVVLLDVVMETDDAGLVVAKNIRHDIQNEFVRIVLRTGQPGKAPERQIISQYDINDYKEKTELTAQKLFTTITSSLRTYRDLRIIEKNRRGLELIIESSAHLFEQQSLNRFAKGVLTQLISILRLGESSMYIEAAGFTASEIREGEFRIVAATGRFENAVGDDLSTVVDEGILAHLKEALEKKECVYVNGAYVGYFPTSSGATNLLYLSGCQHLTDLDRDLVRIFSANVAVAFENIYLNRELMETHREMIMTLGEVLENRSFEIRNHTRRVAEASYLLARLIGMEEPEAEILKLASPMHDLGKVGVPDAVLLKPGSLTAQEFEMIKAHTTTGWEILRNSTRDLNRAAAIVALQHHERWDGQGYPKGLAGEDIHIYGRITCITDVFDALTHRRVYKPAWDGQRVTELIREQRGKYFDPALVDVFLENLDAFFQINEQFPDIEDQDGEWPMRPLY
ncbi:MAG: DUF3369 domain-containing protein [Desulfatibacillaceae bacterium]